MRPLTLLAITLLASGALAGCANNDGATPPTATTAMPTTPASPTPTTSVVPVTPPVTPPTVTAPTTPVDGTVAATVTRVYVTSSPEKAANGTNPEVCWRVEGTGTITHTAVHWGTTSNPNGSFADYPNAVYPNNGAAVGQHRLPGAFCASVGPVTGTVYYKAHAMVTPAQSQLSIQESIVAGSGNATIDTVGAPEVFPAGLSYSFCWELPGVTGSSTHTAIHFDLNTSHPTATTFADYPEAVYPGNGPASGSTFNFPGTFCANITMPQTGALYLRAHAILNGTHYLGPERSVVVAPRIALASGLPATAAAGSAVEVCWRAEGDGTSTHTAVHSDTTSHPNATAFSDYPDATYPDNGPASGRTFELPGPFCADLTMPASGALYFRPHVIYPAPGGQELGPEYSIRVA